MITKAFAITKLSNLSFLNQIPMKIFCEFQRQNMFKSSPHQFDCLFSKNDSRTNRSDIMWSSSVAGRTWKHFHIDMKMYDQRQTDYFCKLLVKIFSDVVEAEQSRAERTCWWWIIENTKWREFQTYRLMCRTREGIHWS